MSATVKIGGIPYGITMVDDSRLVAHSDEPRRLWGEISYGKHSIRVERSLPEREARVLLHEILHGIVEHWSIRELIGDDRAQLETPIDQLAHGLAEALESMGMVLPIHRENG